MAKAQENPSSPDDLKKVCLHACVSLLHSQLTVATAIENTDLVPQLQTSRLDLSKPSHHATSSKAHSTGVNKYHKIYHLRDAVAVQYGDRVSELASRQSNAAAGHPHIWLHTRGFDHNLKAEQGGKAGMQKWQMNGMRKATGRPKEKAGIHSSRQLTLIFICIHVSEMPKAS